MKAIVKQENGETVEIDLNGRCMAIVEEKEDQRTHYTPLRDRDIASKFIQVMNFIQLQNGEPRVDFTVEQIEEYLFHINQINGER